MGRLTSYLMGATLLLPFLSFRAARVTGGAPWALAALAASTLVVAGRFAWVFTRRGAMERLRTAAEQESRQALWAPPPERERMIRAAVLKLALTATFLLWVFIL